MRVNTASMKIVHSTYEPHDNSRSLRARDVRVESDNDDLLPSRDQGARIKPEAEFQRDDAVEMEYSLTRLPPEGKENEKRVG